MSIPNPEGGHTAYGVTVYEVGEDGECIVAFGHHDTRRFIAACNHMARTVWGYRDLSGDTGDATYEDTEAEVIQTTGWFDDQPTNGDWEWELHVIRPEGRTDDPVPVTMWSA